MWGNWDRQTYHCDWCDGVSDEDDYDGGEMLSAYDVALIWVSHGKDEDYTFGYSEEELENALY